MNLGNNLYQARRKTGYSQEEVAAKIGVSRQTISKWETNETIPDIFQSKKMALMYGIALDDPIAYDAEVEEIQDAIDKFSEQDAFLVLKDILYRIWQVRKKKRAWSRGTPEIAPQREGRSPCSGGHRLGGKKPTDTCDAC